MKELIADLEAQIRSGQLGQVRERINEMSLVDVPRLHAARMANLALRAGALFWAVRLLNPIVRMDSSGLPASPEEKVEYAFALNRIGAHKEAQRILTELTAQPLPKVQLYLAAIHANAWEYDLALGCFERYLKFVELTPYERQIGRLNLASCMIASDVRLNEASEILSQLRDELSLAGNHLLHGNSIELTVQLCLKQNDLKACREWIEAGKKIFSDLDSMYSLFFKKWEMILMLKTGDGEPQALASEIKAQATRFQHHETLREADFHLAIATEDAELFNKVYFGTPWPRYRERLMKLKPSSIQLRESYIYSVVGEDNPQAPLLEVDALGARVLKTGIEMKSGQLLHRVLCSLLSDFYRPKWVAAVFTHLFPDEFYHPEAGPKRVHQAVFRLRKWFDEAGVPLEISEDNGRYSLIWKNACKIQVKLENIEGTVQGPEAVCRKILQLLPNDGFATQDVSKTLGISPTLARQALRWGVENKRFVRFGSGAKTRYKKPA